MVKPRQQKSSSAPQPGDRQPDSSVAHDRRPDIDRGFNETRESDELGSELERETGIEELDDEDIDTGRSDR